MRFIIIKLTDMKKIYTHSTFLFSVLIIFNTVFGQTTDWVARYNGPANKFDGTRAMVIDAAGNIYVTGPSEGKKGNVDYATIKYNSAGVQQWVARYNGTGNGEDWPYAIAVDASGNVYVTGRSLGIGTNLDYATIKYNTTGIQQWALRYAGPANQVDIAKDITVDGSGNVYVTGLCDGNTVSGTAYATIKYNSAGSQQWLARYDGSSSAPEDANSLALDGNGNIYVTGRSSGILTIKYDNAGQLQWTRNGGGSNGQKVLVDAADNIVVTGWGSKTLKYNSSGDLIWETTYPGNATFEDMVLDQAGNVYITGYSRENGTSDDYRTVKYDVNGVQQWSARFNGSLNSIDLARSVALDASGNVYVTGHCSVNDGSRNGSVNYGTIKYDNSGVQQWAALYDGPDKQSSDAFVVATDPAGNVYVSGQSAAKLSSFDFLTVKYASAPASKSVITQPVGESTFDFQLRNYPNPFMETTTIEYQLPKDAKVRLGVYDLLGREVETLVNEEKSAGTYRVNYTAKKLAAGTYISLLRVGELLEHKKIVIAR